MFLISVCFGPSRSQRNDNKPGIVYFRIAKYGLHEPELRGASILISRVPTMAFCSLKEKRLSLRYVCYIAL